MKNILSNIKKGPLTTVIGLILVIVGIVLMFLTKATITESTTVIILGLALLGVPDPRIPLGAAKAIVFLIWMAVIIILVSGCATFSRCAQKFGTGETHTVTVTDTIDQLIEVPVPGDQVQTTINIDSMLAASIHDTLRIVSQQGRAQITFWKDRYNNYLHAHADCPPDTIEVIEKIPYEVQAECPDTVVLDPAKDLPWYEKIWSAFQVFSAWAVLVFIGYMVIRRMVDNLSK